MFIFFSLRVKIREVLNFTCLVDIKILVITTTTSFLIYDMTFMLLFLFYLEKKKKKHIFDRLV